MIDISLNNEVMSAIKVVKFIYRMHNNNQEYSDSTPDDCNAMQYLERIIADTKNLNVNNNIYNYSVNPMIPVDNDFPGFNGRSIESARDSYLTVVTYVENHNGTIVLPSCDKVNSYYLAWYSMRERLVNSKESPFSKSSWYARYKHLLNKVTYDSTHVDYFDISTAVSIYNNINSLKSQLYGMESTYMPFPEDALQDIPGTLMGLLTKIEELYNSISNLHKEV